METKIEYQISSETAEKLAIEQAALRVPLLRGMRWKLLILFGVLVAALFASGGYDAETGDADFSLLSKLIAPVIGFCLGFGGAFLFQFFVRTKILHLVRQQARTMQQKLGAARTVSWDAESLVFSSPMGRTQINWRVIDELVNGKIGIHLLSGNQVIWGIPKMALPPNLSADDLIKIWKGYFSKPPKLT